LRGDTPNPDGPRVEAMPSASRVNRALARLASAWDRAEKEWEALPPDIRDGMPTPDQMTEGVEE
jgi:hypothetical protein